MQSSILPGRSFLANEREGGSITLWKIQSVYSKPSQKMENTIISKGYLIIKRLI